MQRTRLEASSRTENHGGTYTWPANNASFPRASRSSQSRSCSGASGPRPPHCCCPTSRLPGHRARHGCKTPCLGTKTDDLPDYPSALECPCTVEFPVTDKGSENFRACLGSHMGVERNPVFYSV